MLVVLAALFALGCGADFEIGGLGFSSSLSRVGAPWTPGRNVALGSDIHLTVDRAQLCLRDCTPAGVPTVSIEGDALTLRSKGVGAFTLQARSAGAAKVSVETQGYAAAFWVGVVEPSALVVSDPLVGARDYFEQVRLEGTPGFANRADVGEELVVHEGAIAMLDLVALDGQGHRLGVDEAFLGVAGTDVGKRDGRVTLGSTLGVMSVSLPDGGLAHTYTVRPGHPDEVVALDLVAAVPGTMERYAVLQASALRADGGVYLAPPLEWTIPPEFERVQYEEKPTSFPRRSDLEVIVHECFEAGSRQVKVQLGALFATVEVPCVVVDPPPPPPAKPRGCSSAPGVFIAAASAWLFGRRRKARLVGG